EIGDHTVFHGANGFDVARNPPQHLLGFASDCLNDFLAVRAAIVTNRNDGRLVQHDALSSNVDERIGGTKVDRHIAREITAEKSEHACSVKSKLKKDRQLKAYFRVKIERENLINGK